MASAWTRDRTRVVLACLAGGVVLGVGATFVVAAWTDQENGTASLRASVFATESRGAGEAAFAPHPSAPGATLAIEASALSPGATAITWIDLRTTAETTVAGTATLSASTPAGTVGAATDYRAVLVAAGATCTGAFTTGATYVAGGSATYVDSAVVPTTATPIALPAAAASAPRVCFEVRLDPAAPSSLQGQTGSITWTFTAQSVS